MKSVLISIKPQWCELIASGKKTIEVRKTMPNLDTPFKVYIYETKALYKPSGDKCLYEGKGEVIGEFVCDQIQSFYCDYEGVYHGEYFAVRDTMLTNVEMHEYGQGKDLYGWHISNLVIYDKPKELGEFYKPCPLDADCLDCKYYTEGSMYEPPSCNWEDYEFTRPPRSWCYVEEME